MTPDRAEWSLAVAAVVVCVVCMTFALGVIASRPLRIGSSILFAYSTATVLFSIRHAHIISARRRDRTKEHIT